MADPEHPSQGRLARAVQPAGVAVPGAPYSQAVVVPLAGLARLIFVSGQGPVDAQGRAVGADMATQARQAFANIAALLAAEGAALADVVELTIYVRDISQRPAITAVRQEILRPPYPATTMVEISALAFPDWLVEVSAVAIVPGNRAAAAG